MVECISSGLITHISLLGTTTACIDKSRMQDMQRFCSAQSKLLAMAYNIARQTLAVLTNRIILSFRKRLTLCFAGIKMRPNAMYICQILRQIAMIRRTRLYSNEPSRKVDSLPLVGHFKNLLLRDQLNSFARIENDSVTRNLQSDNITGIAVLAL